MKTWMTIFMAALLMTCASLTRLAHADGGGDDEIVEVPDDTEAGDCNCNSDQGDIDPPKHHKKRYVIVDDDDELLGPVEDDNQLRVGVAFGGANGGGGFANLLGGLMGMFGGMNNGGFNGAVNPGYGYGYGGFQNGGPMYGPPYGPGYSGYVPPVAPGYGFNQPAPAVLPPQFGSGQYAAGGQWSTLNGGTIFNGYNPGFQNAPITLPYMNQPAINNPTMPTVPTPGTGPAPAILPYIQ
jgi:hypothetical protein